jgi:hypothetical protein
MMWGTHTLSYVSAIGLAQRFYFNASLLPITAGT